MKALCALCVYVFVLTTLLSIDASNKDLSTGYFLNIAGFAAASAFFGSLAYMTWREKHEK